MRWSLKPAVGSGSMEVITMLATARADWDHSAGWGAPKGLAWVAVVTSLWRDGRRFTGR